MRAKKATACLLFITRRPLANIETSLTQFGGAPSGAAGPIRNVASRTCDLLPTVIRVAEILHPTLELGERQTRLLTRLDIGIPSTAVDLAVHARSQLTRGDYLRLLAGELASIEAIEAADDQALLDHLNGDQQKLAVVRTATQAHRERESDQLTATPILEPYEA